NVTANEDGGLTVSGTAEPGSTVTVTYPDGTTSTTTADADGNYSVTTDVPQTTGTVDVTATDVAGNTSEPTEVSYEDTGAPVAPVVNVTANEDGGLTVSGTAEPGSTVTVTYPDGSTGTTTADADGNYSVTTTVPQTSGEVTATATDAANNISEPTVLDYTDTGAPVAPVVNVTANEDGGLTVSGTAEPGSTVTVTYPDGTTGTTTTDADGNYSVTTTVRQTSGEVTATATDAANNISDPGEATYTDTDAPLAPVANVTANEDGGLTVSGTAEPGSTVTVTYPDGSTGTATADADGNYSVTTTVPQTTGTVTATATDAAENTSAPTGVSYTDTNAPLTPVVHVMPNADNGVTVSGTAEAGTTVTVTYPDGSSVTTTADANGNYSVTTHVPQAAGNVSATATDAAGHVSDPGTTQYVTTVINADVTTDTTPIVTGTIPYALTADTHLEVKINGVTYSSANGAVVVDKTANTWYVQIPDGSALPTGTYDVSAVVVQSDGSIAVKDIAFNELTVAPTPTVTFGGAGSGNNKGTALTLGSNGQWQIFSNQIVFNANATDSASLGTYSTTVLTASTTQMAGANQTQNVTFADIDRNGTMDIIGEDSVYLDGQQAWIFDGTTYKAVQIGLYETAAGNTAAGTTNDLDANVYAWYGGVAIYDGNGDGLADIIYGDNTPNDEEVLGGYDSSFLINTNGTVTGFVKNGTYVNDVTTGATNTGNATPQKEVSGVDINNDGTIDIVYHADLGTNKVGASTSGNVYRLVVASNDGTGKLTSTQIVTNVFYDQQNTTASQAPSMTWADFNGDGFMDLFLGATYGGTYANSTIYFNDGQGHLMSTNVTGIGTPTGTYTMGDSVVGGPSLALDWNGDGKMDIIEAPQFGATGTLNLYMNNTSSGVANFSTLKLMADGTFGTGTGSTVGGTSANGKAISGMVSLDLDWDGAQDLLVFTSGGTTTYVHNTNTVAYGTSLHLRILDQNGINAFYGATVELVNSAGVVVATQIINAQSGNQTNNSTGIVDFYGLDPNDTYSVVLLRNVNGTSSDVGGVGSATNGVNGAGTLNVIENVNMTWSDLTTGDANHAYMLMATSSGGANDVDAYSGRSGGGSDITGTGYNDTFFAQTGTAVYDGAGGTSVVSGVSAWSDTGGMDIVDYQLAGSTPLTIDLSVTTPQFTGYNTATFKNIEGIAGGASSDTFTDNAADNQFEGRGGNDTFNLVHGGHDTLMYHVLDANDATGGNGSDIAHSFKVGVYECTPDVDRIDIHDLLVGYTGDGAANYVNGTATLSAGAGNLSEYVSVTQSGADTVVSIDRDGSGGDFSATTLLTLTDVHTDLATLLANHQLVVV
ncbi:Ig-like domain-containing protein, partial [Uliginosibacterium sp. sgz301328]|uniref:Ig-like domain-containing protein n=1 Tax=Uliginosibacterium sp. sgz301328 TaxID=3243764 RepID=UPI00359D0334